jgi:hypothetical protein
VPGCQSGEVLRRYGRLREVHLDGLCSRMFDAGDLTAIPGPTGQAGHLRDGEDDTDEDGP